MRLRLMLGFNIGWRFFFLIIEVMKSASLAIGESINLNQSINNYICVVAEQPNGPNPQILTLVLANCGALLF